MRLTDIAQLPQDIRPGYDPATVGPGIVHLGLGAFHKAHQAALTDTAIARSGGDWRIIGVSLRSPKPAQALMPQNGLYTLLTKGAEGTAARVIGAICEALCSAGDPEPALAAMTAAATRIVSLTVTEKAYGLDRAAQGCDPLHPAVAADLKAPQAPQGVLGLLTEALRRRRATGTPPFTVLCCDNLPDNGVLLRGAVIDFARRIDPGLSGWIADTVAFPSTMVDRITPATTETTLAEAAGLTGTTDLAAVETESFFQWVIEDNFPLGRPAWDLAGAIFTDRVDQFEKMKLRMLNGTHSMLAYAGFHAGDRYVRDAMQDAPLAALVRRHLSAAAATLPPIAGIGLTGYADELARRFRNPGIAHETFQIAMDGSEKMPQRIFSAVADARAADADLRPFAFATAAWARHCSMSTHDCAAYDLRDPQAALLRALAENRPAADIVAGFRTASFVPPALGTDDAFWTTVTEILTDMLLCPMTEVIAKEAE